MTKIPEEVTKIKEIIVSSFNVNKIFLFGSYAKGNFNDNSDFDICIITDDSKRKLDLLRLIRKKVYNYISIPMDMLIYRSDEFEERADKLDSIEREIRQNGIKLYG
ncbi:MAG: nucleotidyltransferase domain-containing protein [Candidatus Delongbacteria bacterium]|nr:nucleotidyltransferase domain-containing protein [Candidatus Delongbacteria bacterium]MCG2759800.1 nucleotidyltransferase domain-containing protein [Candidatus Delongbacteria bacterium]